MSDTLARAEEFILRGARLVERRLFELRFRGGSAGAVLAALRPYQNEDGGFGNALEPDMRCRESQPVPTQHALEIADAAGFDEGVASGACRFLAGAAAEGGGVPWVLPSVRSAPRAPWWEPQPGLPASINPTGAVVGLLRKGGHQDPWLDRAEAWCWRAVEAMEAAEPHEVGCAVTFLRHAPDRARAAAQLERLGGRLLESGLVAAPGEGGYVRSALDWAPEPDHPLRPLFSAADIEACLDVLVARQQADGGWPIAWEPPSQAAEQEWRGWVTVQNLLTLQANGRLL